MNDGMNDMRRFIKEAADMLLKDEFEQLGKTYLSGYLNLMLLAIKELRATNAELIREIKKMNRKLDAIAKMTKNSERNVEQQMLNMKYYWEQVDKKQMNLLKLMEGKHHEEGE